MSIKSLLKNILNGFVASKSVFNRRYPPGHFYSPIPDLVQAVEYRKSIKNDQDHEFLGVDLNKEEQIRYMEEMADYVSDFDFSDTQAKRGKYRYWKHNGFFPAGDAVVLFCLLRLIKPKRIVEIGSGFSSAVMLDMKEAGLLESTSLHFIEPNPERLRSLLSDGDQQRASIVEKKIQDITGDEMPLLESNDVLFVDSSHVASIGSDLCHILFDLVPKVSPGCYVHFHDVCWPFEYPEQYLTAGRAWNEIYLLRAFLQYNDSFEIVFWGSQLKTSEPQRVSESLPQLSKSPSSSIWIRRKP